jgi:para-aminobenzoate synthetase component I
MTMGLVQHLLPGYCEPDVAFAALCATEPYAVWFDHHGERGTGVSYIARATPIELDPSNWEDTLRGVHAEQALPPGVTLGEKPLGIVLVLPYELAARTLDLALPGSDNATPLALAIDRVLELHHESHTATLYGLGGADDPDWLDWVRSAEQALKSAPNLPEPVLPTASTASWRDTTARYREIIEAAQEAIRNGDAYQLCATTQVSVAGACDPIALHRVLREGNPTHHQALLRLGDTSIVSASPETFLEITADRTLTTRPIKGTRPRGVTPVEDQALADELLTSDKERAENLMIVDLMRNDLSRVCEVGSITVPELLSVETYASVHQLVSTVSGTLLSGADVIDVIHATFPAGSMTGAPKRRAVELLAGWERAPRGLYSGAFGVWRADGTSTLAMTIRSAVITEDGLTLGVGGGITALSDPSAEIAEVGVKALPILEALGVQQVQYS